MENVIKERWKGGRRKRKGWPRCVQPQECRFRVQHSGLSIEESSTLRQQHGGSPNSKSKERSLRKEHEQGQQENRGKKPQPVATRPANPVNDEDYVYAPAWGKTRRIGALTRRRREKKKKSFSNGLQRRQASGLLTSGGRGNIKRKTS